MFAFLAGFGAGAAIGLLFAPKCGGTTRNFIGSTANDSIDKTLGAVGRSRDALHRHLERMAIPQNEPVEVFQR